MKQLKFVAPVLAIAVGLVGYQFLVPRDVSFGLFSADDGDANVRYGLTFLATIVGVILGSFYRSLRALRDSGVGKLPPGFFADMFRSVDMWLGLVASPLVFALLLKASDGMSLPGLVILALENGFCALIIIDSFTRKQEAGGAAGGGAGGTTA